MDWFAHSMRFFPKSASSTFLISPFTAAVDMLLLCGALDSGGKLKLSAYEKIPLFFARIHELGDAVRISDCAFGHELSAYARNGTLVPDRKIDNHKSITTKVTKVHEARVSSVLLRVLCG
jgi:hypothetical protein